VSCRYMHPFKQLGWPQPINNVACCWKPPVVAATTASYHKATGSCPRLPVNTVGSFLVPLFIIRACKAHWIAMSETAATCPCSILHDRRVRMLLPIAEGDSLITHHWAWCGDYGHQWKAEACSLTIVPDHEQVTEQPPCELC